MTWTPNGANAEALAGFRHQVNPGRANENTISPLDSLQADSNRWNSLTPHAVVSTATSEQSSDGSWERLQRGQGGYEPGSMASMSDQLEQGSDAQ